MARVRATRARQRGAAAMEFALTVPLFLALLGGMFYFGVALFARFIVTNAANTAVRTCVIRQESYWKDADFTGCAANEFASLITYNGAITNICNGHPPTVTPKLNFPFTGQLAKTTKLLTLSVSCTMPVGPIVYLNKGDSGSNTLDLSIVTSMPYTLGTTK